MSVSKRTVSLFFGAGAEIGYGLPSGGTFALQVFRANADAEKMDFRAQLDALDARTAYVSRWLPDDYRKKRLHVFGKSDFEGLMTSSLEYRKDEMLAYLEQFDTHVSRLLRWWHVDEEQIRARFAEEMGMELGQVLYGQAIRLNRSLAGNVGLFQSEFFSALLFVLERHPQHHSLKRHIRALLELLVSSCGQQLVDRLNQELFEEAPEQLSVFDDFSGLFSLHYGSVGQAGMELVLGEDAAPVTAESPFADVMTALCRLILDDVYARSLDYQALIDSHFRYLYNPRAQWAKFTRISIFLHTVRRYILELADQDNEQLAIGPGYYHDLDGLSRHVQLQAIGTTNYNSFVRDIARRFVPDVPVYHLNGSVDEWYDPYCNIIVDQAERDAIARQRLLVPLLFTQSGIKPLTSISMSKRYVDLYETFARSDVICIVGYGFNGDDGHINGLFRALAMAGKRLAILHYGRDDIGALKRYYQMKLRLPTAAQLDTFLVNDQRRVNETLWWEAVLAHDAASLPVV